MKRFGTKLLGALIGALISLTVAGMQYTGALDSAELRSYDVRMKLRGARPRPSDIILITIDEATRKILNKSLSQINRADYAKLVDILSENGAELIVFDIDFASSREGDEELARSIACAGNVIMSSFIAMGDWVKPNEKFLEPEIPCVSGEPLNVSDKVLVEAGGIATIEWKTPPYGADAYRVFYSVAPFDDPLQIGEGSGGFVDVPGNEKSLALTLEGVAEGSELYVRAVAIKFGSLRGVGAVNIVEDEDDRVRRIPLVVGRAPSDPDRIAALSLEAAVRATFDDEPKLTSSGVNLIRFESGGRLLEVPLVEGMMLINYLGGRDTFERVSFGDVIAESGSGKQNSPVAQKFKGKIALVGNTSHLAHDEYPTPFGRQRISGLDSEEAGLRAGFTSGLEIHANAIDTILRGNHIVPLEELAAKKAGFTGAAAGKFARLFPVLITLGIGLVATVLLIVLRVKIGISTAIFIALVAAVGALSAWQFAARGLWIPTVGPLVSLFAVYGGGLIYHVYVEGREKRWIKDTFGKYLAPSVVEQITRDPSKLKLGGDQLELTAFFSDIQGFTSISEQLGNPQRLVELLNEYLSGMADIIERLEGTVDKYEGDAIIAFWGAPVHFPDHAIKACLAALEQQKKFVELREYWKKGGKWPEAVLKARVRMGINTGPMVVGNMGSKGRMNYTIMGDAVNLASRLEGVNKQYGSLIMISEDTYAHVRDKFEVRELDTIRVVGKAKPVTIYELLSAKGELDKARSDVRDLFASGLQNYRLKRWEKAIENFTEALKIIPDDGPSAKYIERCRTFMREPPSPDWDGVFEMKTK